MAGRSKLSDAQRSEIVKLHDEEGVPFAELAVRYGVNWRTIARICRPEKYVAEKERNAEYSKRNAQQIWATRKQNEHVYRLVLNKNSEDRDMIEHLDTQENVSGYLRSLVREDMSKEKRPKE